MRYKINNHQRRALNNEQGATTILLAFFVMNILLMTSLAAATIMIYQIQMSRDIANSVPAFYAADAAVEQCLFQARTPEIIEPCDGVLGSISCNLDNGSLGTAIRSTANSITSGGTFLGTKRQIELSW